MHAHPLHVYVDDIHWDKLAMLPEYNNSNINSNSNTNTNSNSTVGDNSSCKNIPIICSVRIQDHVESYIAQPATAPIFVMVEKRAKENQSALIEIANHFWVTEYFISHYNLPGKGNFEIKPITCFPLSHIVLNIDQEELINDVVQLLKNAMQEGPFLVRTGDKLLTSAAYNTKLWDRISVHSSEPILQGIFTIQTSFSFACTPKTISASTPTVLSPPIFAPFLRPLLPVDYFDINSQCMTENLEARISFEGKDIKDSAFIVGMSLRDMIDNNIQYGAWVTVTNISSEDKFVLKHLAQVVHLPLLGAHQLNKTAYLGPKLFSSLQSPINPLNSLKVRIQYSKSPHNAAIIQVAQIITPDYDRNVVFNQSLQKYFSTDKLIAIGDILKVESDLRGESAGICVLDGGATLYSESRRMIYLRVINMACESCDKEAVDGKLGNLPNDFKSICTCVSLMGNSSFSSLYQCGMQNSFVFRPFSNANIFSAPGLDAEVCRLASTIRILLSFKYISQSSISRAVSSSSVELNHSSKYQLSNMLLLHGPRGGGKRRIVEVVARAFGLHVLELRCGHLASEISGRIEAKLEEYIKKAKQCMPCILLLRDIDQLAPPQQHHEHGLPSLEIKLASILKNLVVHENSKQKNIGSMNSLQSNSADDFLVIATTNQDIKTFSSPLLNIFLHEIQVDSPDEVRRKSALERMFSESSSVSPSASLCFNKIARETAGLLLSDLRAVIAKAEWYSLKRLKNHFWKDGEETYSLEKFEKDIRSTGPLLVSGDDFSNALKHFLNIQSNSDNKPRIPNVSWKDVGGLAHAKNEILDTIQLPLQHPELFSKGLRRSGVLLYGPPGTGKTLLAKAVATECSLNFFSVKGPELINPYVGQSEANVREVFARARAARPCVVFFDELDSLAPNRGNAGDSGGVMDRVVSQLLAEIDGLNDSNDVFVIGATNRPDLLDPALLRPGRFDRLVFLGVDSSAEGKSGIFRALTRKFNFVDGFDEGQVLNQCPPNLTGADYYALCSDAMLRAIQRIIASDEKAAQRSDTIVKVSMQDFQDALASLSPSVSLQDLERYSKLQLRFSSKKEVSEENGYEQEQSHTQSHEILTHDNTAVELSSSQDKTENEKRKKMNKKGRK